MNTQFEEKGKIFTQVITKNPVDVIIQTTHHKIIGKIHIRPSDRLIDELNKADRFIAVTDATIYIPGSENDVYYESEFLTVNCDQIIWMLPLNEAKQE